MLMELGTNSVELSEEWNDILEYDGRLIHIYIYIKMLTIICPLLKTCAALFALPLCVFLFFSIHHNLRSSHCRQDRVRYKLVVMRRPRP